MTTTIERKVMTRKIARRMAKEGTSTFRSAWPVGGIGFQAKKIENVLKRLKLSVENLTAEIIKF